MIDVYVELGKGDVARKLKPKDIFTVFRFADKDFRKAAMPHFRVSNI